MASGIVQNTLLLHASTDYSCLLRPVHARHESLSSGTHFPLSYSPARSFASLNHCPHTWVFAVYPWGRLLEYNNCFYITYFIITVLPARLCPLGLSPGYGTLWALNKDGMRKGVSGAHTVPLLPPKIPLYPQPSCKAAPGNHSGPLPLPYFPSSPYTTFPLFHLLRL